MADSEQSRAPVGRQLRGLRERVGISGRTLATRSGISQSKISRIERGYMLPSTFDIRLLAKAMNYSVDVVDRLVALREFDVETAEVERPSDRFVDFGIAERHATQIDVYITMAIPALFQTPQYFAHWLQHDFSPDEISRIIKSRFERQSQLHDPTKTFRILIGEHSFLRFRDARAIWEHQMRSLAANLSIGYQQTRTITNDVAMMSGLYDNFVLLDRRAAYHDTSDFRLIRYGDDAVPGLLKCFNRAWEVAEPLHADRIEAMLHAEVDLTDNPTVEQMARHS